MQIEHATSDRRGQFVSFDITQLTSHLLKIESLIDFRDSMRLNAQKFLQGIYEILQPQKSYFSRFICSKTLNNMLGAVTKFFSSYIAGKPLAIQSSREMPLTAHMITIDEDALLSAYFQDPKWQRSSVIQYSQAQAREAYLRAIGGKAFSQDLVGMRQKAIQDLFLDTHMLTLMEQLMEFDFTTEQGVRVLNEWVK